jgi:DNA-binding response OmpR family regulator
MPRILIVDDSSLVTGALSMLLEESGYEVSVAGDVGTAAAACRVAPVDVALLDLSLPDGDGLQVLTALAPENRPRITVALTGHDDDATRARCLAAGCRDVLVKPVPTRELLARMRDWTA